MMRFGTFSFGALARPLGLNESDNFLRDHSIFVDGNGNAVPFRFVTGGSVKTETLDEAMPRIVDKIVSSRLRNGLILVVHGGLATAKGTLVENVQHAHAMIRDGFYPLFLNWDSSLYSSYAEHLFLVRRGRRRKLGLLNWPFHLAADLFRALSRAPLVWGTLLEGAWQTRSSHAFTSVRTCAALRSFELPQRGQIHVGEYRVRLAPADYVLNPFRFFLGHLLLAPIVDAAGSRAWENMYRRTQAMFRHPEDILPAGARSGTYHPPDGVGARITEMLKDVSKITDLPITLVGHSMGTIIINAMLRFAPELKVTNLVYMGAACSIADFAASVLPYMKAHPPTKFYNLCLHPRAEAREKNAMGFAPGGSLLEYLDNYLTSPRTELERTLGKWENAVGAFHIIPAALRDRIWYTAFGVSDKRSKPQRHGEFNDVDVAFWRETFWRAADEALTYA